MSDRTKDRVYVVDIQGQRSRLVRATFGHIAERHVIGTLVNARVASKDDLIELMGRGVKVEHAGDDQQSAQLPLGGNGAPQQGWEQRAEELTGFENTGA